MPLRKSLDHSLILAEDVPRAPIAGGRRDSSPIHASDGVKLGRLLAGLAGQLLQLTRESGIDGWASRDGPGVGADARWITGVGRHLAIEFRGVQSWGLRAPAYNPLAISKSPWIWREEFPVEVGGYRPQGGTHGSEEQHIVWGINIK